MRALFLVVCVLAFAGDATAAGFDCAKASTAVEKTICADPKLSAADDRLAAAFAAAVATTLRPNALRGEEARWLSTRDKIIDPAALLQAYMSRIDTLEKVAEEWRSTRSEVTLESAQKSCVSLPEDTGQSPCTVTAFGSVKGDEALRYQLQSYKDGGVWVGDGAVVFRMSGDRLTPIAAVAIDTAHFNTPSVIASPAGRLLLVPGHLDGTGNFNVESLYLLEGGRVREIDTESWQADLQHRLPRGWGVWKGIYPDYRKLTATTPLWQSGNGNCCPTAGRADIRLSLKDGRLVLQDLEIAKGEDAANSVR